MLFRFTFSESDFSTRPDFKRGAGATSRGGRRGFGGNRGSFRGGRGTNENPKRKVDMQNDNESPPKRSRPDEQLK